MQWLAQICVHRPVFATVIVLLLTVIGGFSFFTLGVDRFPRIDLPTVTVQTTNAGAAPQEMETEVTDVIEGAVNTVTGIDQMTSNSSLGRSNVTITFVLEKDPEVAAQEVRDKVSSALRQLPESADPPIVQKSDPNASPIIQFAISKPGSVVDLTQFVTKQIQERIQSVDGVGDVQVFGGRARQVRVYLDPNKLKSYNLTVNDVTSAISAQNQELPSGRLNEGATSVTLRTLSKITTVEGFGEIVVKNQNGYPIKINDIARVDDTGADANSAVSMNGNPSVSLAVIKQSGANTVAVIQGVKQRMAQLQQTLPPDVKIAIVRDQSEFIETSLHAIEEHLILGAIFAAVVVFIFLWNFRSTLIASLAIPTSIISAFAVIAALGYTLNQMTMLALTLMVGIVIDDAIVVLENIFRFVEEKGMKPFQAAIEGTKEIGLAVLATTLSLLAVFIPVGFLTGIVGRFMSSFGLTSAAAIAVSLIVSFTLTPMLAARWIKPRIKKNGKKNGNGETAETSETGNTAAVEHHDSKESWAYSKIDKTYTWLLKAAMAHRWVVLVICVIVVASIYPLYNYVGINFLPEEDESLYQVSFRAPQGTSLAATQSVLDRIGRDIREQIPGVENTLSVAGAGGGSPNAGQVSVRLLPVEKRTFSQTQLINRTRDMVKKYAQPGTTIGVSGTSSIGASLGIGGRSGASSTGFYIAGPDIDKLDEYSQKLVDRIKQDPNFRDADRSLDLSSPELQISIDRNKAADLGVLTGNVAQALNVFANGQRVSSYSEGTDQFDVYVQADEPFRRTRQDMKNFTVTSSKGGLVSLDQLVSFKDDKSAASIARLNRQRQVTVTASVAPSTSEGEAVKTIQGYAQELNMGPEYQTGVTGQSRELARAVNSFALAFLLSFVFMYLILAAQFESFIHPVTILLTLPLSIPFALLSTLISGQRLNIFSALGILLLFGIVKKNAILQIDHTSHLHAQGMSRYDAIIRANRDRLRPILMTTMALIAGMIPLIVGSGAGAATNRSIGILVVGGQSMCLLLTLLAVPVFYSFFEDIRESNVFQHIAWPFRMAKQKLKAAAASMFTRKKPDDDDEDFGGDDIVKHEPSK
ncbi:MAG TPA: efflux RND transporter permease subunit [Pyrinomonadaceae bacterium]|jgi:HAE1 family hydrophobic/amphiphilic exporter-1|nr:efflux RND transporter permease subunit [Pyrinomonadaceae bacterium]